MSTEQGERQLEKWRKQERFNRLLVGSVITLFAVAVLAGLTLLVVSWLKVPPTLTPAVLKDRWKAHEGETVRVRGRAHVLNAWQVRVTDDKASIPCQFPEINQQINDGDEITVQGTVTLAEGLTECRLIED